MSQADKAERFRALHDGEMFLIPNPWDAGSAKVLEALGYEALATTSAGFAFTQGALDGGVTLELVTGHVRALSEASSLPLSVDLENGFGATPEAAAQAITAVAEAGAVGGSIEDWDPDDEVIYPIDQAAERVAAAVEAAAALGFPFTLTARCENFFRRNPDLDDTIERLLAYEKAGADVLYAPAIMGDQINQVCGAVSKPVNVIGLPGMDLNQIREAGAQRVSIGSLLAWVAVGAFADAARRLKEGDLSALESDVRGMKEWLS